MRKFQIVKSSEIAFPALLIKRVDPEVTFPIFERTTLVNCTFEDNGHVAHKVHMMNMGSCKVPNGYTLTHYQWKRQQEFKSC